MFYKDIYNNRIAGGRSFKVTGWEDSHYHLAQKALAQQGIESRVVTANGQTRIRAKEDWPRSS